jgi:PAS domain S-box-containing protein
MPPLLLTFTRINLWHFVWIAVLLSILLSLLLSRLIRGRLEWDYPLAAALIALAVSSTLIYAIKAKFDREQSLAEALRESQERFSSAFRDAAIGMALVGTDGQFLQVNPALCRLVGYSEQELLATNFQAITHPDDLDTDLGFVRQMLAGKIHTYQMEKRYLHKEGHIVWILLTVSLVRNQSGQPLYFISQIQDITERKQVQEELRESKARLQAILDHSPNLIFLKDTEGRYLLVNRQFERVCHLTSKDIVGKTDDQIFPAEQAAAYQANDRKVVLAGCPLQFEEVALHDDGPHTSIVFKFPLRTGDGHPYAIGGITTDITERKRVEEELRASEGRLRAFMDHSPAAVFIKDQEGRYVYINRKIERRFDTTAAEWIGKTDWELWPKEVAEQLRANDVAILSQRPSSAPLEFVERVPDHTGSSTYWLSFKFPLFNRSGPNFLAGIAMDITEPKRTEEALRVSEQRLREAFEDQERLLQDLHDHVIQSIYAVGMTLETCHDLIDKDPAGAAQKAQKVIADLNDVLTQLRNYIEWGSLAPIRAHRFQEGLDELIHTIGSSQSPAIRLHIDETIPELLTDDEAVHALHIIREALSNCLRHANAKTGMVVFKMADGGLRLEVHDDGVGFDVESAGGRGWGLRNMAARARKLGAELKITSERGNGTRIILDIPKGTNHAPEPSETNPAAAR